MWRKETEELETRGPTEWYGGTFPGVLVMPYIFQTWSGKSQPPENAKGFREKKIAPKKE